MAVQSKGNFRHRKRTPAEWKQHWLDQAATCEGEAVQALNDHDHAMANAWATKAQACRRNAENIKLP